jgi:radical SAM superfamily enzyme YgiQ (UPF0313 family)
MNKKLSIQQAIKAFSWAREVGIETHAFFMLGYIGETRNTVEMTMALAEKLNPDAVSYSIASPLPGTDFAREAAKRNLVVSNDWEDLDYNSCAAVRTEALTRESLLRAQDKAYIRFYVRKKYLWEHVICQMARTRLHDKNSLLRSMRSLNCFLRHLTRLIQAFPAAVLAVVGSNYRREPP